VSASEHPAPRVRGPRALARVNARSVAVEVWVLVALVVLAAVIRILTIDNQSFWTDEALTAYEAHLPFGAMLNTIVHVETTPPLYFVLVWGWAHVFGTSEVALRSISTLAGIAIVPIAYLSARELVSRWAGVLAAAFVAVNPFMIWYSQEARAYMLLAALTGASFLWFIRARRDASRRNLIWWVVFSGLALMTHFFAGFAVAPEAIWLLWISRNRTVVCAVAATAVVQAAMAPFAFIDTSHGVGWIAAVPRTRRVADTALEWAVSLLLRRATIPEGLIGAAVFLSVVALLLALAGDRRTREGAGVAAVIAGSVILVPLALGFIGQDYFFSRNVIPAFIPLVTVAAAACVVPRARLLGGAFAVVLLAVFSVAATQVQTHAYLQRPDWRAVARALGPATVPRAILAADGTTADPLKIYLPNVTWVQLHDRRVRIGEVDVVGASKRLRLASGGALAGTASTPPRFGSSPPRSISPRGAQLLTRLRVDNWIIARFALDHPVPISINGLTAIASRFFRRTPRKLLVFVQQPGR
jgi:mannosyltransferase